MSYLVVDANVWIVADRLITQGLPIEEENCIKTCREWLEQFAGSEDRLLVDLGYRIILEYRNNIRSRGLAEQILNRLESESVTRLVGAQIDFDRDGYATLPMELESVDRSDRKFVAVALQHIPFAPIYVATDRGWTQGKDILTEYGLTIHLLCPDYIQIRIHAS